MHSRIFELTPTCLPRDEQLSEPQLEELESEVRGSIPPHIDYFQELQQTGARADSIQWLHEFLEAKEPFCTFDEKKETIVFHPGFRNAFFAHRFEELKQAVEKLTLDQFSQENDTNDGLSVYRLKKMVETTDGFYVFGEGGYLQTLDTFVRELQYNTTYYIGGILDYHS